MKILVQLQAIVTMVAIAALSYYAARWLLYDMNRPQIVLGHATPEEKPEPLCWVTPEYMPSEYIELVPNEWPPMVCGGSAGLDEPFRCFRLKPSDNIKECDWLDGISDGLTDEGFP